MDWSTRAGLEKHKLQCKYLRMIFQISVLTNYLSTSRNSTISRLLLLPAEIRNKIFAYALGGTRIHVTHTRVGRTYQYHITSKIYPLPDSLTVSSSGPASTEVSDTYSVVAFPWFRLHKHALPLVCRQLYAEAATLVYTHNKFSFSNEQTMYAWHRKRQSISAQLYAVSSIIAGYLLLSSGYVPGKCSLPTLFPNLNELRVENGLEQVCHPPF